MSARLYPGFGSGKGTFEGHFVLRAFAGDREALECGDKIILPQAALKEITRLRLPLPLVFQLHNDRSAAAAAVPDRAGVRRPAPPRQLAGVTEFSAPNGTALVPRWMLANLGVREGGAARVTSLPARGLPGGTFARFYSPSPQVLALATSAGARDALEGALRGYSALTLGERIVIDLDGGRHPLTVVELRPDSGCGVSLYGSVDLEVEVTGDEATLAAAAAAVATPAPPATTTSRPSGAVSALPVAASSRSTPTLQRSGSGRSMGSAGGGGSSGAGNKQSATGASLATKAAVGKATAAPTVAAAAKQSSSPPLPQPQVLPPVAAAVDAVPGRTAQVGVWVPALYEPIADISSTDCDVTSCSEEAAPAAVASSESFEAAPAPPSPSGVVPFSGVGVALGSGRSDESAGAAGADAVQCAHCGSAVPAANAAIHGVRCGRVAARAAAGATQQQPLATQQVTGG